MVRYLKTSLAATALLSLLAGAAAVADTKSGAVDKLSGPVFVRRIFAAIDAHDKTTFDSMVTADAEMVDTHAKQTPLVQRFNGEPGPRTNFTHLLSHFEVAGAGPVDVVAFDDSVSVAKDRRSRKRFRYRESWILVSSPAGLHAVWATYALKGTENYDATRPSFPGRDRQHLDDARDEAAAEFVEHFFDTFSARRADEMTALFLPNAKVVHFTGDEQSIPAMAKMIATASNPVPKYPKPKTVPFDNFTFRHFGDVTLIVFDNHVSHWRDGHPEIEHTFRENWLLEQTTHGLRDVWAAYSIYSGDSTPKRADP